MATEEFDKLDFAETNLLEFTQSIALDGFAVTPLAEEKARPEAFVEGSRSQRLYGEKRTSPFSFIKKSKAGAQDNLTSQQKVTRGTFWMSLSNLGSRMLGAIYIIPWMLWMGEHSYIANGLYAMGYNIYALFLLISTVGIPAAIAKQTSRYNALEMFKVSRKILYTALKLMVVIGVALAALMFFGAHFLAEVFVGPDKVADLVPTIRSLSFALLLFPSMSVVRGFFQGNSMMTPYAMSQFFEQVARVIYMLVATYVIMKVMGGSYVSAVAQSTFAAFIGILVSCGFLFFYWTREKPYFDAQLARSKDDEGFNAIRLLKETVREAIPFILVGSAVQIFRMIDQFTFIRVMSATTEYSKDKLIELFSVFSANPDKLTMVIIALATSISLTSLPLITENIVLKKYQELAKLINHNIQLFMMIMLPAVSMLIVFSNEVYVLFYNQDTLGSHVLIEAALSSIIIGFYMMSITMLQGMCENRSAIKFLAYALIIKLVIQIPCIHLFQVYGPLLSTSIALLVAIVLVLRKMKSGSGTNYKITFSRTTLLLIISLISAAVALILKHIVLIFIHAENKLFALIIIAIAGGIAGLVYLILIIKVGIARKLLGSKIDAIEAKLPF
ncbi:MAG: polysaccharide biosynthesis protein [Lactobacillales bacterium]|jgi:O-antigen/teichoic acid export membrane protein|nr:polysaccharide biosynthesis protein [Lactobacillales bacterium]